MKRLLVFLVIVAAVGGGGAWWYLKSQPEETAIERRAVYNVHRRDLVISVTEGGTIEAVSEVTITCQVQGSSQIIYIIPEGSYVKKDDLLVELDSSDLVDRISGQEISYQNALNSFTKSQEDLAIQKSVNESSTREAELSLDFARIDLEKYRDGDWPQDQKKAQSDITIAEAELKRAQDRLTWTEQLEAKGYATRAELEADRLTVKKSQLQLDQNKERYRLLEKYEYPQRLRKLEADVTKKDDELKRVRKRAASALAQAEADKDSKEATLDLQKSKLDRLNEQLQLTKIYAPQDGLVVYASSVGRRWRSSDLIAEGATVRQRQELIKLPDTSKMKVSVKIHESRMNQVNPGQTAYVIVDAFPDRRFKGRVAKVGILPDAQASWLNPDLKVYSTDVWVEDPLPADVKPGLSARAEIIIAKLENVIAVPIQCVTAHGNKQVVYRLENNQPVPVPVTIGMFNEAFIEVKDGLAENDVVLLNPPLPEETPNLGVNVVPPAEVTKDDAIPKPPPAPEVAAADTDSPTEDKADDKGETRSAEKTVDLQLAKILARLPEDKRAEFRKRWATMSDEERQAAADRLRTWRKKENPE